MHVVMAGDYPSDPNQISGGVEAVVYNLTQALQAYSDLKLSLITLGNRGSTQQTRQHGNVTVYYLPASKLPGYLSTLANIRQIRAKMLSLQPDLIHAQVAGEYAEAAARCGCPWVLTLHGIRFLEVDLWRDFLSRYYRGWFVKREERRTISQAEHIISISPYIHSVFNGQLQGQVYDIENPIDKAFFQIPLNRQPYQIFFVGRLIPRKGVHTLLQAFALLHDKMPEAKLRIAGDGGFSNEAQSYPWQLKQIVHEAGLEEAVTFLGPIDKPTLLKEYENCAVLVVPSVQETAPMVIMEAMAAGNAVVSTDAGGARFLVESGQTGYIVPINDEKVFAENLYQLLSDQERLETISRYAREQASQRFHADIVAAKTREVYYRILDQSML